VVMGLAIGFEGGFELLEGFGINVGHVRGGGGLAAALPGGGGGGEEEQAEEAKRGGEFSLARGGERRQARVPIGWARGQESDRGGIEGELLAGRGFEETRPVAGVGVGGERGETFCFGGRVGGSGGGRCCALA